MGSLKMSGAATKMLCPGHHQPVITSILLGICHVQVLLVTVRYSIKTDSSPSPAPRTPAFCLNSEDYGRTLGLMEAYILAFS